MQLLPINLSILIEFDFLCSECSCGGRCLSVEYTDRVGELAKKHGLKLHIDGARIFNASVVSTLSVAYNFVSYLDFKIVTVA